MRQEIPKPAKSASSFFVGSEIDDRGLNPFQFRVLGHLHRRAGANGRAFPSVASIAETCQIGERVVRRTLRELIDLGLITATARSGRSTVYTPVTAKTDPLPIRQGPPADQQDEGIPKKEFPTTTPPPPPPDRVRVAPETPPERVVVAGGSSRQETSKPRPETPERALFDVLGGFGIVGGKQRALSRSGLTPREAKRICRRVQESGGRAGAMVLQLEAQAGRKAEGLAIVGADPSPPPPPPIPKWQDDMTTDERAAIAAEFRKFRQAS